MIQPTFLIYPNVVRKWYEIEYLMTLYASYFWTFLRYLNEALATLITINYKYFCIINVIIRRNFYCNITGMIKNESQMGE
ncbi:hypothetical protein OAI86_04805 [Alphaproteobacteria bacterium]|nr:hypothetical protein [Alphaproteobacteria bacterium]